MLRNVCSELRLASAGEGAAGLDVGSDEGVRANSTVEPPGRILGRPSVGILSILRHPGYHCRVPMASHADVTLGESRFDDALFVPLPRFLHKHIAGVDMTPQQARPSGYRPPPGLDHPMSFAFDRLLSHGASQIDNNKTYLSNVTPGGWPGSACVSHMAQMPPGSQEMPAMAPSGNTADGAVQMWEASSGPQPGHDWSPKRQPFQRSAWQFSMESESLAPTVPKNCGDKQPKGKKKENSPGGSGPVQDKRWWTQSALVCPLTKFPICLLPYPPFKLRVDPSSSATHKLYDGKYLAMKLIASGNVPECGRELEAVDLDALDEYMQRCKLGPYKPGRAIVLAKEAASSTDFKKRAAAAQELKRFRISARIELGKLRRIQESRLVQLAQNQRSAVQGQ